MHAKLPLTVACPRALRPAVLRLLHDGLPSDQQGGLAQTLHSIGVHDESAWDGLLVTLADSELASDVSGVAWVQLLAGETACLWIPPEQGASNRPLLRAAASFVDARDIPLAQLVVGESDGYATEFLEEAGFPKFAELLYLYADLSTAVPPGPATRRHQQPEEPAFVGHAGNDGDRFGKLLERTYIGTLDCPGLDGIRPLRQVLEGYRSQGNHRPEHWYTLLEGDQDVGALILTEHRGLGNWELIYMGLVPEVRGRGWGSRVVQFALQVAASEGAERLVLAVDANNQPALKVYRRLGFVDWARRIVYARLQSRV